VEELSPEMRSALTYANMSVAMNEAVTAQGEWCGMPIVLPTLKLTLIDNHPLQGMVDAAQKIVDEGEPPTPDLKVECTEEDLQWQIVNEWYSRREQRHIAIVTNGTRYEVVRYGKFDYVRRLDLMFSTFKAYLAWNLTTEATAAEKLRGLINKGMWTCYMLTGTFVETSPRSKITYVFRRLRPTIAVSWKATQQVLCALCLHPIGYYDDSFAGSMCPTDEVIAHLLLMRGDEHLYWKRANQHQPWMPEAGL
jgi:hypothetical protein